MYATMYDQINLEMNVEMNVWMIDCMNEWMNENWMNESTTERYNHYHTATVSRCRPRSKDLITDWLPYSGGGEGYNSSGGKVNVFLIFVFKRLILFLSSISLARQDGVQKLVEQ